MILILTIKRKHLLFKLQVNLFITYNLIFLKLFNRVTVVLKRHMSKNTLSIKLGLSAVQILRDLSL